MDPATTVVVFGLLAAATWGAADFGGGLAGRSAPLLGVLLFSQLAGCVLAAGVALATGERAPATSDLAVAAVAGIVGALGIGALYRGLQVGRMGVVAPVSGALAAIVPVSAGILFQGLPGPAVVVGIALAVAAVILVSATPGGLGERPMARVAGIPLDVAIALVAGVALGAFSIVISRFGEGSVFAPLVAVRGVEAVVVAVVIVGSRRSWRLPRTAWPLVLLVGALDATGNGFFVLSSHAGRLDVAAALTSLYPVSTLVLAAVLLRERLGRTHAIGVAAALAAIVLVRLG